jgi:hypothetical protein
MATLYDTVFKDLIIDKFDKQQACRTVHEFFGENNVNFAAIDGTEYSKPMFDMVIFYAGAYSCEGNITFSKEEEEKSMLYIMTNSLVIREISQAAYRFT